MMPNRFTNAVNGAVAWTSRRLRLSESVALRRADILVVLLLASVLVLYHWRGLRLGYTFLAVDWANNILPWLSGTPGPVHNLLVSDPLYQFYPFMTEQVARLKELRLLLWTPSIHLGHPAFADPLFQTFYPLFPLFGLLFGVERGFALAIYLHLLLAAGLTYGYARSLGLSMAAGMAAALTYSLSGYLLTWMTFTFWVSTLAWLPGILWAFHRSCQTRRLTGAAATGLLIGLAILAGQLQFALAYVVVLGILATGYAVVARAGRKSLATWPLLGWAIAAATGLLVGGVQLIPFGEFLPLTRRQLDTGLADALPVTQLVTLVVPNFFGSPVDGLYWGWLNYNEGTVYAGVVALSLALAAVAARPRSWIGLLGIGVGVLIYFIVGGPGVSLLGQVPGLKYLSLHRSAFLLPMLIGILAAAAIDLPRVPLRAVLVPGLVIGAALGMAILAEWEAVREFRAYLSPEIVRALALAFLATLVCAVWHRAPRYRTRARFGLLGLIVLDLFLFGANYNPAGPIRELFPPTPSTEYLAQHAGTDRVLPLQLDNRLTFVPNILMRLGRREPGGYSSLIPADLYRLVTMDDPDVDLFWFDRNHNMLLFSHPSDRLMDMLAVRYLVAPEPLETPAPVAELVAQPCGDDTVRLEAGQPIGGAFRAKNSAINRIDLPFSSANDFAGAGTVVVQMRRAHGDMRELMLEEQISLEQMRTDPNRTLYFAPEIHAPYFTYQWQVAAGADFSGDVRLCRGGEDLPAVSIYGVERREAFEDDRVYINERYTQLPRAYVVYGAEPIADGQESAARVLDPEFDVRNSAVTVVETGLPQTPGHPASPARMEEDTRGYLRIQATADAPGLLVLTDLFYPGWVATVDGEAVPILRVNHLMRGVLLAPGEHQIEWRFRPASLRRGGLSGLAGILILPLMWWIDRRRMAGSGHEARG